MDNFELKQRRNEHLKKLWATTRNICPTLSTFYSLKQKGQENDNKDGQSTKGSYSKCYFCNCPFLPGNHRVRLLPREKLTPRIRKIVQKYTDNPESLGKFQTKLAKEYIEGRNKLAVTCFTCKKTVKHPGQSRYERQQQKELLANQSTDDNTGNIEVPKSRKEKKKEKKKQMKKNKKEGKTNDINAGLILDKVRSDKQKIADVVEAAASTCTTVIPHHLKEVPSSSTSPSTTKSVCLNLTNKSTPIMSKGKEELSGLVLKSTQSDRRKFVTHHMTKSVSGGSKPAKNKNKSKLLSQQLGNILKQEQNKPIGGSLSDFLSSL